MLRLKSWTQPTQPFCLTEARYPRSAVYRSAAVYFQAILGYQARHLHVAVEPIHRSAIKDAVRSIRRGLGPAGLKDSFDVSYLSNITHQEQPEPFSVENPVHMLDVVVLGLWFMLREAEIAAARLAHLTIDSNTVSLLVPVHKTDQVGSLSMRQLNCACRYRRHHLWCLMRLAWQVQDDPTHPFGASDGWHCRDSPWWPRGTPSSLQWARFEGQWRPNDGLRWHSHPAHPTPGTLVVSGGAYVQTSHLSVVPSLPAQLLGSRPPELLEDSGLPAPGEGTLHNGLLQHRKQVPTHELMDSNFAGILDSWNSWHSTSQTWSWPLPPRQRALWSAIDPPLLTRVFSLKVRTIPIDGELLVDGGMVPHVSFECRYTGTHAQSLQEVLRPTWPRLLGFRGRVWAGCFFFLQLRRWWGRTPQLIHPLLKKVGAVTCFQFDRISGRFDFVRSFFQWCFSH